MSVLKSLKNAETVAQVPEQTDSGSKAGEGLCAKKVPVPAGKKFGKQAK